MIRPRQQRGLEGDEHARLNGTNMHPNGHMGKKIQTELMVKIYSKSLVGANGKVFLMKLS